MRVYECMSEIELIHNENNAANDTPSSSLDLVNARQQRQLNRMRATNLAWKSNQAGLNSSPSRNRQNARCHTVKSLAETEDRGLLLFSSVSWTRSKVSRSAGEKA